MHLNSRTLILTFLFVLLLLASHASAPAMLAATAVQDEAIPAERLLNADGTLNLNTGYSGSVDLANWRVDLDPQRGPVLAPKVAGTWNALGTGISNGNVLAIAISGSNVYVGGFFTDAGGNANADYIARWNGSTWSALGSTPLNDYVGAIALSGSNVYVGGTFTDAGGNANADRIAFFAPTQSTTTLTASPNPALVGQAVTLRAMVSCPGFTPTGNVQFSANGSSLGTVALNGGGQATLPTSFSSPACIR